MSFRRYEILLPTRYDDGALVEDEKFAETRRELVAEYGAVSWHPERLRGIWSHEGQLYEDEPIKVVIDVEDTAESQSYFRKLKESLKNRFRQIDIWMVSYEVKIH